MKIGTVIAGKYRIERVIGRGAMGVVVQSTDVRTNHRVAVKLILPQYASDEQLRGRFIREAHVMTRLQSQHVAQVFEVGELDDGTLYLSMEYLEGQSLEELVSSGGPLPVVDAVDLMLEALDAVAEAHSLGLVHRDIKPSNLFLCAVPGAPPILKVLDFGIVKDTTSSTKLTATGTLPGTPAYMAPEQIALEEELIDARADIWSFGVTLHEVLTGELPFNGPMNVMLTKIRAEAPPRIRATRPDVAPELEAIVARCLSKHPAERYGNAAELRDALHMLRVQGLVRTERGAERNAAETAISIQRGQGRRVRETAETMAADGGPAASAGGQKSILLPAAIAVFALVIVVGLVLALQGRFSSTHPLPPGTGGSQVQVTPSASGSPSVPTTSIALPVSPVESLPSGSPPRKKHPRIISARNTGDRAWRAWLDRHRLKVDNCASMQPCAIGLALRLNKMESKVAVALQPTPLPSHATCNAHRSLVECMSEVVKEPVPGLDVCTDGAECVGDVLIAFD